MTWKQAIAPALLGLMMTLSMSMGVVACLTPPSRPVDEMSQEEFDGYLRQVESVWEGRATAWLYENPRDADELLYVAGLVEDALAAGATGTGLLDLVAEAAQAQGVHPLLLQLVREAVMGYNLKLDRGVLPESRYLDLVAAVARGVRSAATP